MSSPPHDKELRASQSSTPPTPPRQQPPAPDESPASGGGFAIEDRDQESQRRRYVIRDDDGKGLHLSCVEAPNIAVRVERGAVQSVAAARKAPSGTIFLDGAAAGEPFMDAQRGVYNLDHHEGCVRPFTLATCEQAMVLLLKGLDLSGGEWTVYANEPDLDTVLAIWVLLNHRRLASAESQVRPAIMPLLRLEGAIDANGPRFAQLCAFPPELLEETQAQLDRLRRVELEVKEQGRWSTIDFLPFTADVLRLIDASFYSPGELEDTVQVEELLRIPLTEQRIGVVCRADTGIYEVERELADLHGNKVGLLVLQKDPATYTLRLVDPFLPASLNAVYERLNLLDPAVEQGQGNNAWGGSAEIGGSPRQTGTALSPAEIAAACRWVFQPRPWWRRGLAVVAAASAAVGTVILATLVSLLSADAVAWLHLVSVEQQPREISFGFTLFVVAMASWLLVSWKERRAYGLRWPANWQWVMLLPLALPLGAIGGAWTLPATGRDPWESVAIVLAFSAVAEVLHRGLLLGLLVPYWNIQRPRGPWFVSKPNLIAALVFSLLSSFLFFWQFSVHPGASGPAQLVLWSAGAFALALVCGVARERSGSLLPAVVMHVLAATMVTFLPLLG
jgi:hypothetical protein